MKRHDHRASLGVSELHVASPLTHALEPASAQRADDISARDDRQARIHAATSTCAMISGSARSGIGASSK